MGRGAVLWAAIAVAGLSGWPVGALGPATARAGPGAPGLEAPVGTQARAATGEVPLRHVLAGQIDRLIDHVVDLNENHGWSWSATGALIAAREEAFIDLDDGRTGDAARQLRSFRARISAGLAERSLEPDVGAPLLAASADLLARVEALGGAGAHRDAPAEK
jgi:hypothetical protein